MLKKSITFTDLNGEEVTEDHFFHLSQAELVEMEMSEEDGLSEALKRIIEAEDGKQIIKQFKEIILGAYGKRSQDGRRFIKNQQLREEFESSEAYSAFFMELVTNTDSAIEFVNGIVPAKVVAEAASAIEKASTPELAVVQPTARPVRRVSRAEISAMSQSELSDFGAALASGEAELAE